ncbi:MAG: ABC transporter ATP-binding protein [Candidatus Aminicenantes bacterium]|nr:ABC transporter ATP-binding protein [Candidatus Aminicenantes bacterium]
MSVSVRGLSYARGNFRLRIDSLEFESGRLTSIVGPNGAGKTTLLMCLGGLLAVPRNRIFIQGRDIASLKDAERARLVSSVPQEHNPIFNYSVLDFVVMGRAAHLSLFSLPSAEDVRLAEESLAFVGLQSFASRPYFELSSGERRLILIARALAQRADVLLLDEPTSFLDPKHEIEILELTRKLAVERGQTILLTLHNLDMAIKYSDSLVFMKNGGVFASGRPRDILSDALLESVYDVRMKIVDCEGQKLILR